MATIETFSRTNSLACEGCSRLICCGGKSRLLARILRVPLIIIFGHCQRQRLSCSRSPLTPQQIPKITPASCTCVAGCRSFWICVRLSLYFSQSERRLRAFILLFWEPFVMRFCQCR